MACISGFWSYVHLDDKAESGRIAQLARDLASQYSMITGDELELFLDRDSLEWGDSWRTKIDERIGATAFIIPVITPRYFTSPECRRELNYFLRHTAQLGTSDLILPLYYADVKQIESDDETDDLVTKIRSIHRVDWRDLRFCEVSSSEYRRNVANLATRIAHTNSIIESTPSVTHAPTSTPDSAEDQSDDLPGTLDKIARTEEAMPEWQMAVEAIGEQIALIGNIMEGAAEELQSPKQGKSSFAHKLKIARALATDLSDPIDSIQLSVNDFNSCLHDIDDGMRILIPQLGREIADGEADLEQAHQFITSIQGLCTNSRSSLASVQRMIESTAPIERLSRDLRPPMRKLRKSLAMLVESQRITDEWLNLIGEVELPD